jgi:hypothetical protein
MADVRTENRDHIATIEDEEQQIQTPTSRLERLTLFRSCPRLATISLSLLHKNPVSRSVGVSLMQSVIHWDLWSGLPCIRCAGG